MKINNFANLVVIGCILFCAVIASAPFRDRRQGAVFTVRIRTARPSIEEPHWKEIVLLYFYPKDNTPAARKKRVVSTTSGRAEKGQRRNHRVSFDSAESHKNLSPSTS